MVLKENKSRGFSNRRRAETQSMLLNNLLTDDRHSPTQEMVVSIIIIPGVAIATELPSYHSTLITALLLNSLK